MKKFFSIFCAACCALAFASCDDEAENPYAAGTSISVVSANLDFSPEASDGVLHFASAGGTVTATSRVPWCTARVSGDSVIVSVEANANAAGRSAVVVLHNGADSVQVALTQRGVVLDTGTDLISCGDAGGRFVTDVTSNINVELVSAPEWVGATVTSDSAVVVFDGNATGHLRSGHVVIKSGNVLDTIKVVQADFDTDIAGSYDLCYYDGYNGELTSLPARLTESALVIDAFRLTIPMTFDPETMQITLQSGSYIGRSGSNYVYLVFGAGELYWTQYLTTYSMTAPLLYDDAEGTTAVFGGELNYGDNFVPEQLDTFFFQLFSSEEMSADTDRGALFTLFKPNLKREPAAAASYVLK